LVLDQQDSIHANKTAHTFCVSNAQVGVQQTDFDSTGGHSTSDCQSVSRHCGLL